MIKYHKHHIIPRHMGGTDEPDNLIHLTVEEHAEAHRKLYEKYGRWQDEVAWRTLSGQISTDQARRLTVSNSLKGKPKKAYHKNKLQENLKKNGFHLNPIFTDEHRSKLSKAKKRQLSVVCPHCQKSGQANAMARWHFDNCKYK